jgi:hypothetical protein
MSAAMTPRQIDAEVRNEAVHIVLQNAIEPLGPSRIGEQSIRDLFLVAPADRRTTVESRAEYWAAYEYTHLMIACDVRGLAGAQP